jgi:actinorhodin biosynthesis protein ActVIA
MTSTITFTDVYTEIQQFYARQVHLLDRVAAEEFAATFTEDAVFQHHPGEPRSHGRGGIVHTVRTFNERFVNDPTQRRHWFNMLSVTPEDDGTISTTFYALVISTKPGGQPVVAPSCVAHDVLVRDAEGGLLTRSRVIEHDEIR